MAFFDTDDKNLERLVRDSREYNIMSFLAMCAELEKRLADDPGLDYRPTAKQEEFHNSRAKIRLILGGNRSGKTHALSMEVRFIALDEHPWMDTRKMKVIWVVGLDKINMLAGTLIPKIEKAIPERYIKWFDKKNYVMYLHNGKKIVFKSCDSGVDRFQSADVDAIALDEEPPYDIYKEVLMRTIDRGGVIFIAMTPTNGISWSFEHLYRKRDGNNIHVVEINTYDNTYLKPEEIAAVEAQLTEEEREMRIKGKYVVLGGRKVFDWKVVRSLRENIKKPLFVGELYNGQAIEDPHGGLKLWEKPDNSSVYYIGVDTSEGIADPIAVSVLRSDSRVNLVATYNRKLDLELMPILIQDFGRMFKNNLLVVERNSTGSAILSNIRYTYNGQIYTQEDTSELCDIVSRKLGWHTSKPTKRKMIQDLREYLVIKNLITIPDEDVIAQMENYIEAPGGEIKAQTGHDDLVMSLMLALQGFVSLQGGVQPLKLSTGSRYGVTDRIAWHSF
jgi:phage terminase large subunit-like protein